MKRARAITVRDGGVLRAILIAAPLLVLPLLLNELQFSFALSRIVKQDLELTRLAGRIVHLDEVLTMSARMSASTGSPVWAERYDAAEPELERVIEQALALAPEAERASVRLTEAANRELVARERACFEAVERGDLDTARALVFDERYEALKVEYLAGVDAMIERFDRRIDRSVRTARLWSFVVVLVGVIVIAGLLVALSISTRRSRREERLRSELALAERRSTLGRLAASLAHELNQPLSAVVNYTGAARMMLERSPTSQQVREALNGASEQAERAGTILRRVRDFARPSHPTGTISELLPPLRDAISLVEARALEHRVEIQVLAGRQVPGVEADTIELQQVFVNLLLNAIEASEEGGIVRVRVEPDGERVRVEIEDEGVGIPAQEQARVFDAFFSTKDEGSGLGLAIVRDILDAHRATIELVPKERGTLMRLSFIRATT